MTQISKKREELPGSVFHASPEINHGTVAIEQSRAVAEAQGKIMVAQNRPRNVERAVADILFACGQPSLANVAFYSYPRGGSTISGPSIRLAEDIARCWGNIDYGIRELSQKEGSSEYEVYCWDMQTNTSSTQTFTVKHLRDTNSGTKKLTDQRDIYEVGANMAGRRVRARIMAVIPKWLQELAIEACKATLANPPQPGTGHQTPAPTLAERVLKMTDAFMKLDIQLSHIEARIKKPVSQITAEDLVELIGIHNSIRDGISHPGEWFENVAPPTPSEETEGLKTAAENAAKTRAKTPKNEKPESKPAPVADQEPVPPKEDEPLM